jgi:hypothetical protein
LQPLGAILSYADTAELLLEESPETQKASLELLT